MAGIHREIDLLRLSSRVSFFALRTLCDFVRTPVLTAVVFVVTSNPKKATIRAIFARVENISRTLSPVSVNPATNVIKGSLGIQREMAQKVKKDALVWIALQVRSNFEA
jgi:hypothetical protein